ncbi:hypothetical protein M3Y97_00639700 [Aphelenchoides bicaudatus]|nr:hypothetical protein M3Y97_00639700 [Aphelenchoides bicaudatus]
MKRFWTIFLFIAGAQSVVQWPFKKLGREFGQNVVDLYVGTPSQYVQLIIATDGTNSNLQLPDFNGVDGFYARASTTFQKLENTFEDLNTESEVIGTDNFLIESNSGKEHQIANVNFSVVNEQLGFGFLSIIRPESPTDGSFLRKIFEQEGESVAVFVFDETPIEKTAPYSGVLTLGGRSTECSHNWEMVDEVSSNDKSQWHFELKSISAKNFVLERPGVASINLASPYFYLPSNVYNEVMQQLGSNENGKIPCNSPVSIVFKVGSFEFNLTSDKFTNREFEDSSGCFFLGQNSTENAIVLPYTILRNNCFLLDFNQKRVGFAERVHFLL